MCCADNIRCLNQRKEYFTTLDESLGEEITWETIGTVSEGWGSGGDAPRNAPLGLVSMLQLVLFRA